VFETSGPGEAPPSDSLPLVLVTTFASTGIDNLIETKGVSRYAMRNLLIWAFAAAMLASFRAEGQTPQDTLAGGTDSTLRFVQRDGTCIEGKILKADATSMTVSGLAGKPIYLQKDSLLGILQANTVFYSGRSSWADVAAVTLHAHEALVLSLKSGKKVKGKPSSTTPGGITVKHGPTSTLYSKSEIATIDVLRIKPATDNLKFIAQEAPWLVIFDPEFYSRATGLWGTIPVRLYDAAQPEDETTVECKTWR